MDKELEVPCSLTTLVAEELDSADIDYEITTLYDVAIFTIDEENLQEAEELLRGVFNG